MFLQKIFSATLQPSFRGLGPIAVLALACVGSAQISKAGGGYLMRVKYVKGQVLKYSSMTSMINSKSQGAKPILVSAPMVVKVTDYVAGKATLAATLGPMTMGGQQIQPAQKVNLSVDSRNSTTDASPLVGTRYPVKAVKVGDTWNTTAPIPGIGSEATKNVKATYKFVGIKTVASKAMAVIAYSVTGGANGSGTLLVLVSDGTLYSNKARLTMNLGGSGTMIISSEFARI
jgi:hypothetical protein